MYATIYQAIFPWTIIHLSRSSINIWQILAKKRVNNGLIFILAGKECDWYINVFLSKPFRYYNTSLVDPFRMYRLSALVCLLCLSSVLGQKYSSKYDDIEIDQILSNKRVLNNYIKCILDEGPCTPDGREFRGEYIFNSNILRNTANI